MEQDTGNGTLGEGLLINGVFTLISLLPVTTRGHLIAISPGPATPVVYSSFDDLEREIFLLY